MPPGIDLSDDEKADIRSDRVASAIEGLTTLLGKMGRVAPVVNVTVPKPDPVAPPVVNLNVPEMQVTLPPQTAPAVQVNLPAMADRIPVAYTLTVTKRDGQGRIKEATLEPVVQQGMEDLRQNFGLANRG